MNEKVTAIEFLQGLLDSDRKEYEEFWEVLIPTRVFKKSNWKELMRKELIRNRINHITGLLCRTERQFVANKVKKDTAIIHYFIDDDYDNRFRYDRYNNVTKEEQEYMSHCYILKEALQADFKSISIDTESKKVQSSNGKAKKFCEEITNCVFHNGTVDDFVCTFSKRIIAYAERTLYDWYRNILIPIKKQAEAPKGPATDDISELVNLLCSDNEDDTSLDDILNKFAHHHPANNANANYQRDARIIKMKSDGYSADEIGKELELGHNPAQAVLRAQQRFTGFAADEIRKTYMSSLKTYYRLITKNGELTLEETKKLFQKKGVDLLFDLYFLNIPQDLILNNRALNNEQYNKLLYSSWKAFLEEYTIMTKEQKSRKAELIKGNTINQDSERNKLYQTELSQKYKNGKKIN